MNISIASNKQIHLTAQRSKKYRLNEKKFQTKITQKYYKNFEETVKNL